MSTYRRGEGCHAEGCSTKSNRDGYCQFHWRRWMKLGDPLAGGPPQPASGPYTDTPAYRTVHLRLAEWRGTPSLCENCGTTQAKQFDWALRDDPTEVVTDAQGRNYSTNLDDYNRLCHKCHMAQDFVPRWAYR